MLLWFQEGRPGGGEATKMALRAFRWRTGLQPQQWMCMSSDHASTLDIDEGLSPLGLESDGEI